MFSITAIPAFSDNYIWCLHRGDEAWVVDPGDATPVEQWLQANASTLSGILVTHHHPDHTGGIARLTAGRDIPVLGPANSRIQGITRALAEGDVFPLFEESVDVWEVPGHTLDHLAFLVQPEGEAAVLFCGDTLFSAGCGRLFEGTPRQMLNSLKRIASLPADTRIFCTHEYTLSNLRFARAVMPRNQALQSRTEQCQVLRDQNLPTLPVTLGAEKAYNPFLLQDFTAVRVGVESHCGLHLNDELAVFTELRRWKDGFR